MSETDYRGDLIRGLRNVADFLEKRPSLKVGFTYLSINLFVETKEELAEAIRELGTCDKRSVGEWLTARKSFGPHVCLEVNAPHDKCCERVVVGTKVIPAKPSVPERIEEIVEWRCPTSILQPGEPHERS